MKRINVLTATMLLVITFSACEKKDENTPPELPPYETMMVDFKAFDGTKSAEQMITPTNYIYTKTQVGVWSTLLGMTMAVPVAAFYRSFEEKAVWLGNGQWQWTYDVNVLAAKYTARLVATVQSDKVLWEMNVLLEGFNGHPEFRWFEGVSKLDGKSGSWTLYHSYQFQEKVLEIDWKKEGDAVASVQYNYVRTLTNTRTENALNGCFMKYGLQDNYYDAYIEMYVFDFVYKLDYVNLTTEWSTTQYDGHVKSTGYFGDSNWHCWNNLGEDTTCQ